MIKYTITIECENDFDVEAITDAVKNKITLEQLYNEVFRPVIKYDQDERLAESYEIVWEKVAEYLKENDVKF